MADIRDKEDAKKLLSGDLKQNIEKGNKIAIALEKLISSLKKLKNKISKMLDKSDKEAEVSKNTVYSKLYGYTIETIGLMKKIIELCNYSIAPHFAEEK